MSKLESKLVDLSLLIEETFLLKAYIHNNYLIEYFDEALDKSLFTLSLEKESLDIFINVNVDHADTYLIDILSIYDTLKESFIPSLKIGRVYYVDINNTFRFDGEAIFFKYKEIIDNYEASDEKEDDEDDIPIHYTLISKEPINSSYTKEYKQRYKNFLINKKGKIQ